MTQQGTENVVHKGLRAWAKGMYPLEAGVELLIRAFGGRFAEPGQPWIQPQQWHDYWVVDWETLHVEGHEGPYSGGERRVLRIAASLGGDGLEVPLNDVIPGLDRAHLELVLAAIAHAAGSHEFPTEGDPSVPWPNGAPTGPMYPWPEP